MCTPCSTPTRPFVGPGRLLAGVGASAGCADELRALGVLPTDGAVLLVADSAVLDLGLHRAAVSALEAAGHQVLHGPGISAEPTPAVVQALLPTDDARVAAVVAIGGGSALDAAKLVSVSIANALDLGAGLSPAAEIRPGPPILAVPTTAGTGAEATAVAMLWHEGGKRMFVHSHLVPRGVLLDPELLLGLPSSVTASGGFDAIGHAVESLLSTFRTPVTIAAAREALSLLSWSLPAAYDKGDLDARYGTALGAYQAGLALNASVVLGHSLAYAIATRTGLPHGVTVAMALPYCLAHARSAGEDQIADMAEIVCGKADPELFVRWILEHSRRMRIPTSLQERRRTTRVPPRDGSGLRRALPASEPSDADRPARRARAARTHARRRTHRSLAGLLPYYRQRGPRVTTSLYRPVLNLVGGDWHSGPEQLEVRNPADIRELVATVPSMDAAGVHAAFDAAERAAATWRRVSQVDRGRILLRAAQLIRDRRDELSRTLTLEMGKTLAEASGEVGKAADFFEYYGGLGRAEVGTLLAHENADVMAWAVHEPLGVVLAITPWNDPLLTPARKLAPALIAGNTVVLKPASDTPVIALDAGAGSARRGAAARRAEHRHRRGPPDRGSPPRPPGVEGGELHGFERRGRLPEGITRRPRRPPAGGARWQERRRRSR